MATNICNNCGVELEADMCSCPLCGNAIGGNLPTSNKQEIAPEQKADSVYSRSDKIILTGKDGWKIASIILGSIIIITGGVDFSINTHVSWSKFPIAASLVAFAYISIYTFLRKGHIVQIWGGFLFGSVLLLILDGLFDSMSWTIKLGVPLLFAGNLVVSVMFSVIHRAKQIGINIIAFGFVAIAFLCLFIESILSLYFNKSLHLIWSLIATACLLPVAAILLFLHYRLKKGRDLKRTFHV